VSVLEHLEPKCVFRFFEELCRIPHGSGNTKEISDWCVEFARKRNLEFYQDAMCNVILMKEATTGYEAAEPLILQGHLDMVCEKSPDCVKNMDTEGLDLAIEGDYVYAEGTTLGADDGIAVAMALALLDADDISHPRLEVILTSDEEVGMLGAAELDVSPLKGKQLLNLDSEEEGIFTVSCAGGSRTACRLDVRREEFAGTTLQIGVSGLSGGHSGAEIHKGRANADMLLGRLLRAAAGAAALRLVSVSGGLKDNAIPTEASAVIVAENASAVLAATERLSEELKREYRVAEPALSVEIKETAAEWIPMDQASTDKVLCLLACLPNGVQEMSRDIEGLVQTSLNLGILETDAKTVSIVFCIRSSVASQREMLQDRIACLVDQLGGTIEITGEYPAWEYQNDSALRERMVQVFLHQYGRYPKIEAIHAGLECGLLCGKVPGLDCVSFGPDLMDIHTPREKMSISSVQRVWAFLLEVLEQSK